MTSLEKGSAQQRSLRVKAELRRGEFSLSLDLTIPALGVTAIFGKNGSGKTSLLRVIAGLDRVDGATVIFGDRVWQDEGVDRSWVAPNERGLGYVFQEPSLFEHLSVAENINYARKRVKGEPIPEEKLALLRMDSLANRRISELSGGEKQRVAIARALISNPQILLMDEPVSALDAKSKDEVLRTIQEVHRLFAIPILYVSHSLDEVARISDRVMLIRDGSVAAEGPTISMMVHPEIGIDSEAGLEAIIEGKVVEVDEQYGLRRLEFSGGSLWVANGILRLGDQARARVLARDISLTLSAQENTSIQNILPVKIVTMRVPCGAHVIVEVAVGDSFFLVQVTRRAADQLSLQVGGGVYAQIKSVALLSE